MKTMAIRLEDDVHAQLAIVAQLDGVPLADVIRQAIEAHIERKRSEENFAARAQSILEEIDREASAKREAIQALFSQETPSEPSAAPKGRGRRGGNGPKTARQ